MFDTIYRLVLLVFPLIAATACSAPQLPPMEPNTVAAEPVYRIGPGDGLTLVVWMHPELETSVTVRPDGRITVPILQDIEASGRTPAELADEVSEKLSEFVLEPLVTVTVNRFVGLPNQQVRVLGAAAVPSAIPYTAGMTLLDVMVQVGGLTEFANGNRAVLSREVDGKSYQYRLLIDGLLRDGNISANVALLPGDVIVIPERVF